MRKSKYSRIVFKMTAAIMAAVFLWDQVVWASELAESTIERLNNQQTQLFAPSYLQSREDAQSRLVNQMQEVEDTMSAQSLVTSSNIESPQEETVDLKGPVGGGLAPDAQLALAAGEDSLTGSGADISVTTQAGDIIHYVNGVIDRVEQADGTILRNIVVDEADNLLRADIVYTDGTTQVVEGGRLVRALRPDGNVINYDSNGRIGLVAYAAGATVTYTYVEDVSGNVIETVLTNSNGTVSRYDSNGKLLRVTKPDGTVTEYAAGILSKITKPDGKTFIFGQTAATVNGRTETIVTLKTYIDEFGNNYNYLNGGIVSINVTLAGILYNGSVDGQGILQSGIVTLIGGTKLFLTNGKVTSVIKSDGSSVNCNWSADPIVYVTEVNNLDHTQWRYKLINGVMAEIVGPDGIIYEYTSGILSAVIRNIGNPNYFNQSTGSPLIVPPPTTGVVVTDGKYLYIKRWGSCPGLDYFTKVGTGFGGTVAGKNYGTLSMSSNSYSAAYHSDGYIYVPTTNPYVVEKISVVTGSRAQITIQSALIKDQYFLITSDGRYIYNIGKAANGWSVKVYDPAASWSVVRTYTVSGAYYVPGGLISDGRYLYIIERTNTGSARITISNLNDGTGVCIFGFNQTGKNITNGQYDFVNNRFIFGSYSRNVVYSYTGLVQRSGLELISSGMAARIKNITDTVNYKANVALPSNDFLNIMIGYRKLVYNADSTLLSAEKYDGTKFAFTNGEVSSVIDANGNAVDYSYDYSDFNTVLDVSVVRDGIKRFYDIKGELKSITTADDTKVIYEGNTVSSVAYADGTTLLYNGGRVDEAVDKDGTHFTLGADDKPTNAVDKYGNIYIYSYSTDTLGRIVTVIEDQSRSETRRYVDNVLIRTEGSDGSVSENSYYVDGRLKDVRVTRLGRIINLYLYTYNDDGTTEVSDINENVRKYGADGRLLTLIDMVGNVYQYSYPDSVTTRMELVQYNGPQGVDDLVIAQDFINNILRSVYRANGTVTSYTLDGRIDYVSNFENDILVDYQYDDGSNLTAMVMAGARRDLERSVEDARNNIEEQRAQALAQLASQRGIVIGQIDNQVAPDLNNLISQRNSLRSQWNNLNNTDCGWDPFGTARREKSRNLDTIGRAIAQVEAALSQIYAQLADAYAEVDSEVAALKAQIDAEAEASLAQVKAKEDELAFNISKQEASAFVLYCYRTTLGRDPDQAEVDGWVAKLSPEHQQIDRTEIVGAILESAEYDMLKENITRIKQDVRTIIGSYLSDMDPAEKSAFLSALGLAQGDVVTLTQDDAEKILDWIDSQGMHFGQSAFYALENILKSSGIDSNIEEVAVMTILVDILVGDMDVFTKGDLQISMYALSKFAETKGVSLYNTKLTFEDLVALQTAGSQLQAIAHIDGNHYIVVTGIDGDTIHYREENRGASGTSEVMSKSDFLKKWSGFTITKAAPQDTAKIISDAHAKKVKGAFFFFLVPLIGAIVSAITGVVAGIVSAITTIVAGVIGVVSTALANIATFIATAGSQLLSGIGAAFTGIGQMVGTFFGSSLLGTALNTAVSIGLSIGIQTGLEALGVNSTISSLTGAFLTGGVLGLLNPVKGVSMLGSFMSGALKYATVAGINELAPRLNLDPGISGILSITAGALVDGFWQGDLVGKLVKIAPNIRNEMISYGITSLGGELGLDPRLVSLVASAGSAISTSCLQNSYPSGTSFIDVVKRSLNSAIVAVGVNLLDGINSNISTILRSTGITNAVETILNREGIFNSVFTILNRTASTVFNTAGSLISNIFNGAKTFVELTRENGIVNAVNTALSSLFSTQTLWDAVSQKNTAELLSGPANEVTLPDGRIVREIILTNNSSIFLDESGELVSVKEDGITSTGTFVWTQGNGLSLKEGVIEGNTERGYSIWADIDNGMARDMRIFDDNGNQLIGLNPEAQQSCININSVFNPLMASYDFVVVSAIISFANNHMAKINGQVVESITQKVNAISAGSLFNDTDKFLYALANGIRNPEINLDVPPPYIFNLEDDLISSSNGAISKADIFSIALYQGMTSSSVANGAIDAIKWLIESQTFYNKSFLVQKVQNSITAYFITHPSEWSKPIIGMGYSGGFMPLIEGTSHLMYNMGTIIGLGGPSAYIKSEIFSIILQIMQFAVNGQASDVTRLLNEHGLNSAFIDGFMQAVKDSSDAIFPFLKEMLQKFGAISNFGDNTFPCAPLKTNLIVNVWGSEDIFYKLGVVDYRNNFLGKTTYNLEIMGATHTDYIRGIDGASAWNDTVARFVADLMLCSTNEGALRNFLNGNVYDIELENNCYVVRLPGYEAWQ